MYHSFTRVIYHIFPSVYTAILGMALSGSARDENGTDTELCQQLCESPEDGPVGPKHVDI
jgi:hypothetical protein